MPAAVGSEATGVLTEASVADPTLTFVTVTTPVQATGEMTFSCVAEDARRTAVAAPKLTVESGAVIENVLPVCAFRNIVSPTCVMVP